MNKLIVILFALVVSGCSDDDSPTAPGNDLIGSWEFVSSTNPEEEEFESSILEFRENGTATLTIEIQGVSISVPGTWEVVAGKLILLFEVGAGRTQSSSEFTVRNDRLTVVLDSDGTVETWERR